MTTWLFALRESSVPSLSSTVLCSSGPVASVSPRAQKMAPAKPRISAATPARTARGTLAAVLADPSARAGSGAVRFPLRCQASVANSNAAACWASASIHRRTAASSVESRSGPCNSVTHRAACARMRRDTVLFCGGVMIHERQQRTGDVPLDGDVGDAHVTGNFRVTVPCTVRKIDVARPPAHAIQQRPNAPEALLRLQALLGSRCLRDQGRARVEILERHFSAQIQTVAPMLVDGQVMYGMAQESLLIGHQRFLTVHVQAQH